MEEIVGISTRDRILMTAAEMFSTRGYDRVTTRQIAKAIGINSASIYHHFSSKDEILRSLYDYYSEQVREKNPDLEELLKAAETSAPHEVLAKTVFHFSDDIRGMLDHIIVIASRMITSDPESERFIKDNIFDNITKVLKPLLHQMVELGKIKPFDEDNFFKILTHFCFSAAALNNTTFRINASEYQSGMSYLFSMVMPMT